MYRQWQNAAFVPNYSGGPVPDFNRVPNYVPNTEHLNRLKVFIEINKKSQEKYKSYGAGYRMGKYIF